MELTIFQVDAFTDKPFGGNPAGLVLDNKDLSDELMQNIAKEMNLSETAFVKKLGEDRYYIRFFTPLCEVDLCGHATIGSFYALAKQGYIKSIEEGKRKITLLTKDYELSIEITYKDREPIRVIMEQGTPKSYGILDSIDDIILVSNLRSYDIGFEELKLFPELISTGLKDIILPLKTKEALDKLEFDMGGLKELSKKIDAIGVHAFYLPSKDSKEVYTRNFAPLVGIDEEAATGTANGALIYYLKTHGLISGNEILAHQGESLNRPSKIHCYIEENHGEYKVKIGGSSYITLEGIMRI